jgi:signal peptidase II
MSILLTRYRFHLMAVFLVVIDQVTKLSVKGFTLFGFEHAGMRLGESIEVIPDLLDLTFVENPGMAFGISWGEGKIILTLLTIVIAIVLAIYLDRIRMQGWITRLSIGLLLAGAVGNLIDRMFYGVFYGEGPLFYGLVVDFIQVNIPDVDWFGRTYTHWPVFNIADSCVSVGIILLLIFGSSLNKKDDDAASTTS